MGIQPRQLLLMLRNCAPDSQSCHLTRVWTNFHHVFNAFSQITDHLALITTEYHTASTVPACMPHLTQQEVRFISSRIHDPIIRQLVESITE